MRHQGRITKWNDDRGFGFIVPRDGGRQVFVHISSFTNPKRRPADDQAVTYELGTDSQGRPRGLDVAFVGDSWHQASQAVADNKAPAFAALFLAVVAGVAFAGKLPMVVLGLYLGASAVAFLAYFKDKWAAKRDSWRTPEKTLLVMGLLGGWPGALLAQRVLRHKSSKRSFQLAFWGTVILNCVIFCWWLTPSGARSLGDFLRSR